MKSKTVLKTADVVLIGFMIAVIEVCKIALSWLPNIETTTFWIIMFTLYFGRKIFFVIPAFIAIEGVLYGFGIWWIMYLYVWPLLVLLTFLLKKYDSKMTWCIFSWIFGLSFGALCSLPYFFVGNTDFSLESGFKTAFAWWVAGIPWDIMHGAGNFIVMFLLYRPITNVMKKTLKKM